MAATQTIPRPARQSAGRCGPVEIVIPVFNQAALLERCLRSLRPTLGDDDCVWLIDDASTEPEVDSVMEAFRGDWPKTRRLRNRRNLGFVGTVNRAFRQTRGDLVVLNSDTEVMPGWLEALQACFRRDPRCGIACPLSDHATLLSVLPPTGEAVCPDVAAAAAATTLGDLPLPTAVGFCMLLRREMLDCLGGFSEAFAPGYGEENDLSMRALKAGWNVRVADRAVVFHRSGGSFGSKRSAELRACHQDRLDRIWPEYGPLVQSWWRENPLRIKTEQLARGKDPRPPVVHVLHRQYLVGGTERVTRSLLDALSGRYLHSLIYPGETGGAWCDLETRPVAEWRELMLNNRWIRPTVRIAGHGADLTCAHSERALLRVLRGSGAGIVHFHHLLHWDSMLLPMLARAVGCRVVISVHDFWFQCPVHNQLEHGIWEPCGRERLQPDERCLRCIRGHAAGGLEPKAQDMATNYANMRHRLVALGLGLADAVLVPSNFIRDRLLAAYPALDPKRVLLMPHGVIMKPAGRTATRPHPVASDVSEAVRARPDRVIAYFGGDQVLKGAQIVLDLAQAIRRPGLTFRIYGRIKGFDHGRLPPNVELRGFYNPDDVGQAMADVDLALLPSYYEESFSMVASECWAHGVPVLASNRGALRERVEPGVNGWLVEDMDAQSWIGALTRALEGDRLQRCRERLAGYAVPSLLDSAATLNAIYQDLLAKPQLKAEEVPAGDPLARFNRKLEALRSEAGPRAGPRTAKGATRCLGILRDHWGTAQYRVRFPLEDLARSRNDGTGHFHVVRDSGFDPLPALRASGARHVLVQPFLADEGLAMMECLHREGVHVTLVVDDLWTALREDNPARKLMPEDVPGRLAYAASLSRSLVLTTPELERRLGLAHDRRYVINNALPPWIWKTPERRPRAPGERLRIGWAGAPQHAVDLAFLEPVLRATADQADWVFLGMCPEPLRPMASEFHPMVPFDRYPSALAALNLDLAIAPLADDPFNRCKSHLKVLECGILGVPVVAADLEPYSHCPVPLAPPDDPQEWTGQITELLRDPERRRALGRSLHRWVVENHLTEHRRPDWRQALGMDEHVD
ncbi:MAG: glycosyltransferase [Lysobacterales bacterium]